MNQDYGHQVAKACAAHEDMMAVRAAMFHQDVDFQIGLEKMKVATSPADWVNDWTADPAMELAILYKQIALFWNEPETIGRIVKQILENRLREASEHIVSNQA